MGMRINTNIDAMVAQRNLSITGDAYAKSVAKLSSGLRINSAADDAAGLSISEKLKAQVNGLNQASRNAQDGISMLQTAEGALNETHTILQRMRELTVQGGNDTLAPADRTAIKSELDQLSSEINRIAGTTQFNGKTLLNGSLSGVGTTSGFNNAAASSLTGAGFIPASGTVTSPVAASAAVMTAAVANSGAGTSSSGAGNLVINSVTVALGNSVSLANVAAAINTTAGLGANGAVTASVTG